MSTIGVLGAGTWGTALARMLCNSGHEVTVWSISQDEVDTLSATRRHKNLPNCEIPEGIVFTTDIKAACEENDILLCAVPSVFVRSTMASAKQFIPSGQIIVDVAKGISSVEVDNGKTVIEGECFLYDRKTPSYTILVGGSETVTDVDGQTFRAEAKISGKAEVQLYN